MLHEMDDLAPGRHRATVTCSVHRPHRRARAQISTSWAPTSTAAISSGRLAFQEGEGQAQLNKPIIVYTEFGADAFNARDNMRKIEVRSQAEYYPQALWQEIYEHSGRHWESAGNAIGGYSFQWSDGWWKYQQTINLDIQDNNAASWRNEAVTPTTLPVQGRTT